MGQPASFKKITNISMACIIGVHMTVLQEIYAMMYNAMMYSIKLQLIIRIQNRIWITCFLSLRAS